MHQDPTLKIQVRLDTSHLYEDCQTVARQLAGDNPTIIQLVAIIDRLTSQKIYDGYWENP